VGNLHVLRQFRHDLPVLRQGPEGLGHLVLTRPSSRGPTPRARVDDVVYLRAQRLYDVGDVPPSQFHPHLVRPPPPQAACSIRSIVMPWLTQSALFWGRMLRN
jgi:hypothetical protein